MRTILLLSLLLMAVPVWSEQNIPVTITSNSMQYAQQNDQVVFSGAVHVIRQDIELWSDTLTVFLEKNKTRDEAAASTMDDPGSIKKIVAQGNVRIKADKGRSGTCGKATYDARAELLTLEDNPVLMEGSNKIQGEVIKMYIRENRSEVIGGKQRVQAIFNTSGSLPGQKQ
jgi:lipopolysaccharide export system protein LptA